MYEQRFEEKYCSLLLIGNHHQDTTGDGDIGVSLFECDHEMYSYWDGAFFEFLSKSPQDYYNPFSFSIGDILTDGKWLGLCEQFMPRASKISTSHDDFFYVPIAVYLEW